MAFNFRDTLRREVVARLEWRQDELKRIHGLPDRFLAAEILKLSRGARKEDPERFAMFRDSGYENLLICSVMPAIARQLGETRFTADEKIDMYDLSSDPEKLRELVGHCMNNSRIIQGGNDPDECSSLYMLDSTFVNGNPIVIAVDRIDPPTAESTDWLAKHTREISRSRFGDERFSAWEPAMQNYRPENPSVLDTVLLTMLMESPVIEEDDEVIEPM